MSVRPLSVCLFDGLASLVHWSRIAYTLSCTLDILLLSITKQAPKHRSMHCRNAFELPGHQRVPMEKIAAAVQEQRRIHSNAFDVEPVESWALYVSLPHIPGLRQACRGKPHVQNLVVA